MKKKKIKKKNLDKSDQISGHPKNTVTPTEKKMNIEQNRLIHLNTQLESEKAMLAKLKKEMEEAYFLLVKYQALYDKMQKNLGYIFMNYKQDGDIYTFADGATFNYSTQDFTFPISNREDVFHVYHISFGERVLSTRIEENFVHINLSTVETADKYTYRKIVEDKNPVTKLSVSDSIQVMEIFRAVLDKNLKVEMTVDGGGIMGYSHGIYFRDSTLSPVVHEKDAFQNSGVTIYRADKGSILTLNVTVWGEKMIPFAFEEYRSHFTKVKAKYPDVNEVDFYAGIKANHKAQQWLIQLKGLVPLWFEKPQDRSRLLKVLSGVKIQKTYLANRNVQVKVPDME